MSTSSKTRHAGANAGARPSTIAALKDRLDLVEIASGLTDLKPRHGLLWGLCPLHSERTPSFTIDAQKQRWRCWGCDQHGDAVDLIAASRRITIAEAVALLCDRMGVTPPIQRAEPRPAPKPSQEDSRAAEHQARALKAWAETIPIPDDSDGARYLREQRRLTAWDNDRLRWHPACPWGQHGHTLPAIIAPVTSPAGTVAAIWRIRPALKGKPTRCGLGPVKGGAARLFSADGPELAIGEGIESSLAVHQRTGLATWAALNAGNMRALVVPERFRVVHVFADRDPSGLGQDAAHALAARLRSEGRSTTVFLCSDGDKDANDALMRDAS